MADIYGVEGVGKTRLLEQLAHEGRLTAPNGIFLRDSATELQGGMTVEGEPLPEGNIAMAVLRFCTFLEQAEKGVVKQTGRDPRVKRMFGNFRLAMQAAKPEIMLFSRKINIAFEKEQKVGTVSPGAKPKSTPLSRLERTFRIEAEDKATRIAMSFIDALNEISFGRPLLWTIDDFECIVGRPMGDWLEHVIGAIDGGLVVVSRVPTGREPSLRADEVRREPIAPLSRSDVRDFLEQCLPDVELAPGVDAVVYSFTDGHAATLGLVGEFLRQEPELAEDAERLAARFADSPPELEERLRRLLERIVPDSEKRAVDACAIARRFDADLLAVVLDDDLSSSDGATVVDKRNAAEKQIELLRRHTFIDGEFDPDTESTVYRLQGFIQRGIEERLRAGSPTRHAELHRRAADFYYRWLADFDEEEQSSKDYGGWYRYEDRRWQRYKREWLHHQALADRAPALVERPRRESRMRFARVFLDAFWWWGYYVDFPFCWTLVQEWEATQLDVGWLKDIRQILDRYPTGWRKSEASPETWQAVRSALLNVRSACGLEGQPSDMLTEDERHTRGLIDLFLAHAARYRAPTGGVERARQYATAVGYYEEALGLFRGDKDFWDCAWTLLERADLHSEHGSETEATADWDAAVEIIVEHDIEDEELVANLHRVKSDFKWERGDAVESITAMARAVTHAYLFHNRPHPPDSYTTVFYREMLDRMAARLDDAWSRTNWRALIESLLATPLLACRRDETLQVEALLAGGPATIVELLPRGPNDDELGLERSAFLTEWLDIRELIAAETDDDLEAG